MIRQLQSNTALSAVVSSFRPFDLAQQQLIDRNNDSSRQELYPRVSSHGAKYTLVLSHSSLISRVLISAPRPSAAVPNDNATLAVYTLTKYSFDSHSQSKEIRILDLATGQSSLFSNDIKDKEPTWLGDGNLLGWLKDVDGACTQLWIGDAINPEQEYA